MRKVKVDYYAVEVPYTGNFEDNDEFDLLDSARSQCAALCIGYQYSDMVSHKASDELDGDFTVENTNPANHTCTVFWSEIDETYDGRTEEEKDYDALCDYANHPID